MYYPQSQIKTNLYTSGGIYFTKDGYSYIGIYCLRDDNIAYSGSLKNSGQ